MRWATTIGGLGLLLLALPSVARATCAPTGPDTAICCAPGGPCSEVRIHRDGTDAEASWPDPDRRWELGVTTGGAVGRGAGEWGGGAVVTAEVGIRFVSEFDDLSFNDEVTPGWAACAALLACGVAGISVVPRGALIGNEIGVNLRLGATLGALPGEPPYALRLGLEPVFLVARPEGMRVTSLVGAVLPEVGLEWSEAHSAQAYLEWSPYDLGFLLGGSWALEWDTLQVGVAFGTDQAPARWWMGTRLSVKLLR